MGPAALRAAALAALLPVLAGCDTSASNLGPAREEDLDAPAARQALLNGMTRTLSTAVNWVSITTAVIARELASSGSTNSDGLGFTRLQQEQGILDPGLRETDPHWQRAQQARWVAEDGVRRLRRVLGVEFAGSPDAARALLHVGFANRLLGENWCQVVLDGGPVEPRRGAFERAEAAFTEVLEITSGDGEAELELAARAGRATARVGLGDWPGAVADAAAVPSDFVFAARTSGIELAQYNSIFWANARQPLRTHTVWSTFYETYFAETGDPRTPWIRDPELPEGPNGNPWLVQTKHASRDAPIRLVTGREMRLLEAESLLRGGDVGGALAIVNGLRADAGVEPRDAATLEEVWTALKRERGIELWLEGRRLWDLHRWIEEGTPGPVEDMTGRSTCFPIGQTEVNTNPNVE